MRSCSKNATEGPESGLIVMSSSARMSYCRLTGRSEMTYCNLQGTDRVITCYNGKSVDLLMAAVNDLESLLEANRVAPVCVSKIPCGSIYMDSIFCTTVHLKVRPTTSSMDFIHPNEVTYAIRNSSLYKPPRLVRIRPIMLLREIFH